MVGDFQQSIYGSRADLDCYRRVHEALVSDGGEALTFSATFRLDEAPLRLVNACFPPVLTGTEGQVPFVPLAPRADVLSGQVLRIEIPPIDASREGERAWHEAAIVARWIRNTGLAKLRAQRWSDVAIISPRKGWFPMVRITLRNVGIAAQLQSDKEIRGDHPAVAWFTATVVILAEPENAFEIVGVLREVFGVSDHDLAHFSQGLSDRFTLLRPPSASGPVGDVLRLLSELRASLQGKALLAQAMDIVATTRLRDRLLSLPADEYEGMDEALDDLLTRAAAAESDGLTLFRFAERLRAEFETGREARPVQPDAIQVITGHKAKGSEWPVVVLPFFARSVRSVKPRYPVMYRHDGKTRVAFSKGEMSDEAQAALARRSRQEAERLLYVAMTRAKHTLVIVDDRELFATKKGLPESAQAHLLQAGAGGVNAATLDALSNAATGCTETMRQRKDADSLRASADATPLPTVDERVLASARERATQFVKRNPSALAHSVPADPTKAPDPEALAMAADPVPLRYGIWWHGLMQHLDWQNPANWQTQFEEAVLQTPDPQRAQNEWPSSWRNSAPAPSSARQT
jgi:ATP-dependent exoDNAse (exonuclease V) beta subunit